MSNIKQIDYFELRRTPLDDTQYQYHIAACGDKCTHKAITTNGIILVMPKEQLMWWYAFIDGKWYGDFIQIEKQDDYTEEINMLIDHMEDSIHA